MIDVFIFKFQRIQLNEKSTVQISGLPGSLVAVGLSAKSVLCSMNQCLEYGQSQKTHCCHVDAALSLRNRLYNNHADTMSSFEKHARRVCSPLTRSDITIQCAMILILYVRYSEMLRKPYAQRPE